MFSLTQLNVSPSGFRSVFCPNNNILGDHLCIVDDMAWLWNGCFSQLGQPWVHQVSALSFVQGECRILFNHDAELVVPKITDCRRRVLQRRTLESPLEGQFSMPFYRFTGHRRYSLNERKLERRHEQGPSNNGVISLWIIISEAV